MLKVATIIAIVGMLIQMILSLLFMFQTDEILRLLYGSIRLGYILTFISHGALLFFFVTLLIKQK